MKICFITRDYPLEVAYGGLGTYVYETARSLVKYGHTVHVITEGKRTRDYMHEGVHIHSVLPNYFWFEDYELKKKLSIKSIPRDILKFFIEHFFISIFKDYKFL